MHEVVPPHPQNNNPLCVSQRPDEYCHAPAMALTAFIFELTAQTPYVRKRILHNLFIFHVHITSSDFPESDCIFVSLLFYIFLSSFQPSIGSTLFH
jgi:hypothetical protein